MVATPTNDSDSEMEEMPLRERMAKFDEELEDHAGLLERLAPGPPKVIAPLTVADAFDLLDAAKAKDQKHKKAHHAGEDKAKEKEMPPWWRLNEDYFRELRSGDLARVVPPGGWLAEDDPDLLAPPCGRPATRAGGAEEGTWWRDGTAVSAPSAPSAPATVPGAIASAIVTAPVSPPYVPYIAPKPTGVSVGDDLLDTTLVAEDLAVLARAELLFSELPRKKDVARLASKEFCDVDEKFLEDWLAGVGKCKRREDGDGTCKGVARWLRHRAATSQMDAARELREAQTPPEPAGTAKKQQSGDGPDATALAQSPYKPPAPTVVAIIKTNDDGTVYVGGEEPAKAAAAAAAGKKIHEVVLPKLFKWYKDDFGFSKQEILAYYASFMPDNMREELMEVARSNNFIIKYDKYDWNLHLTKACSEASRQPQRLITNQSPHARQQQVGDPSPTTLGANQVFTPSLHEVQGSHTNISDKVYNQQQQGQRHPQAQQRPMAQPPQRGAPGYDDGQRNAYRVPAPGQPGAPMARGKVPGLQDDANQPMDGFMC